MAFARDPKGAKQAERGYTNVGIIGYIRRRAQKDGTMATAFIGLLIVHGIYDQSHVFGSWPVLVRACRY